MPRLILHIGTMKTGSSAIQRFFARNRAVLPAFGLHYPRATGPEGEVLSKHNDLVEALRSEAGGTPHLHYGPSADVVARYLEVARSRRVTLLSAEGLAALGPQAAQAFKGVGERFDLRVVVYLRRQDEWALSTYREHVMNPDIAEARPFAAWLASSEIRAQMNYDALLTAWMHVVGEGAIRVLRYPQEMPVLPAFLKAADLPRSLMTLPFHGKRVKESVADEVLLAQMAANGGTPLRPGFSEEERDALLADVQRTNYFVKQRFRPELNRLFGMD